MELFDVFVHMSGTRPPFWAWVPTNHDIGFSTRIWTTDNAADGRCRRFLSDNRLQRTRWYGIAPHSAHSVHETAIRDGLRAARHLSATGELARAAEIAGQIDCRLEKDYSLFARHVRLHCKMLKIDVGVIADDSAPSKLRSDTLSVVGAWAEMGEYLNTAIAMVSHALIVRTHAFLDHDHRSKHLREAITFCRLAEDFAKGKCRNKLQRVVAFVAQMAMASRIRIAAQAGAEDAITDRDLRMFSQLSAEAGGDPALIEYTRAMAAYELAFGDLDRAAQHILTGTLAYKRLSPRSPFTYYDWLGRIVEWWTKMGHHSDKYDLAALFRAHWRRFPQIHFQNQFAGLFMRIGRPPSDCLDGSVYPRFSARLANTRLHDEFLP